MVTGPETELSECHQERTRYIGTSRQEVRFIPYQGEALIHSAAGV